MGARTDELVKNHETIRVLIIDPAVVDPVILYNQAPTGTIRASRTAICSRFITNPIREAPGPTNGMVPVR